MKHDCRILIVDDDLDMAEMISDLVNAEGWQAVICVSAESALQTADSSHFHIALIDHHLPSLSGRALAQKLRKSHDFGIIMVTAAGSSVDRVLSLETAADDYVVKPFEPAELVARIKSVLRRTSLPERPNADAVQVPAAIAIGTWIVDFHNRRATSVQHPGVTLTSAEFSLLELLAETPSKPMDRLTILKRLGSVGENYADRNIDVLILRLRRKIELNPVYPQHIMTRRGKGYVLVLEPENA